MENKKTIVLNLIAVFLYILTSYLIYYVTYKLYGNTIETSFIFLLFYPPLAALGIWLREGEPYEPKNPKLNSIISNILITVLTIIIVYFLFKSPYMLNSWIYIVFMLEVLIFYRYIKIKNIDEKSITPQLIFIAFFITTIITTFLFIGFSGLKTLPDVQENISSKGYENIEYIGNTGTAYLELVLSKDLSEKDKNVSLYCFDATKGNEKYHLYISPITGEIYPIIIDP